MDEVGHFYSTEDQARVTHLALCWRGRVRFTVPRSAVGQKTCWRFFQPGLLKFPLRATALMPRLLGATSCVESDQLASIREFIGTEMGMSCCRSGTPGAWSKDTILLMDKKATEPLCVVKAGAGKAVDSLLRNEVNWLEALRDHVPLAEHIPKLVAHRSGTDLSFVAQSPLSGRLDFGFGEPHIAFLRKLQHYSRRTMYFEESKLYHTLRSRLLDLNGLLTDAWSTRLEKGMRRIEQSLSAAPILFVAAHNDFTPWNIRVERGVVMVFDWEYADYEQLPLFDPLHFALMPMALGRQSAAKMVHRMYEKIDQCSLWLDKESFYETQTQALAYLVNLSTLYLWSARGQDYSHPVLDCCAEIIDRLCLL